MGKVRLLIKVSLNLVALQAAFAATTSAWAYKECLVTPTQVWVQRDAAPSPWGCFQGGCIFFGANSPNGPEEVDRMISVWMTAIVANRKIEIRFDDDNTNCAGVGQTQFWSGYWFTNEQ